MLTTQLHTHTHSHNCGKRASWTIIEPRMDERYFHVHKQHKQTCLAGNDEGELV